MGVILLCGTVITAVACFLPKIWPRMKPKSEPRVDTELQSNTAGHIPPGAIAYLPPPAATAMPAAMYGGGPQPTQLDVPQYSVQFVTSPAAKNLTANTADVNTDDAANQPPAYDMICPEEKIRY